MAYKTERAKSFAPSGKEYYSFWLDWVSYNSPRGMDGRLRLAPQTFILTRNSTSVTTQLWPDDRTPYDPVGSNVTNLPPFPVELDQTARARMYSRARSQSAALAMTVATIGQTRDMIRSKATGLAEKTKDMSARLDHARKRGQLVKRNTSLANAWLEYFYGWKPFIADIHDGIKTVASLTPQVAWVSGRASSPVRTRTVSGTNPERTTVFMGTQSACYSVRAEVTQPNAWMLNRLGLINPGVVAWDLVPWSFVVNMFINANSLIGSVSEDVGLSVSGHNLTRTTRVTRVITDRSSDSKVITTSATSMAQKNRTLGALPIAIVFRRPELNWELAVTASALLMQRVNTLNTLADRLYRSHAYARKHGWDYTE